MGAPFLGEIPIEIALRQGGDEGAPLVATDPRSMAGQAFLSIAAAVADRLDETQKPAPRIVVED